MAADKDVTKILKMLPSESNYYFCQAQIPRALPAEQLKNLAESVGLTGCVVKEVNQAIQKAKKSASKDDLIIVGGSTFVVAEIDNL